jgi:hypothetical protein
MSRVLGYPTILERVLLGEGRRKILVVRANCLESPELFRRIAREGKQPMDLLLPVPAQVKDFWTDEVLGAGDRVRVELDPVRGSFFVLEAL